MEIALLLVLFLFALSAAVGAVRSQGYLRSGDPRMVAGMRLPAPDDSGWYTTMYSELKCGPISIKSVNTPSWMTLHGPSGERIEGGAASRYMRLVVATQSRLSMQSWNLEDAQKKLREAEAEVQRLTRAETDKAQAEADKVRVASDLRKAISSRAR